MNDTEAVQPHSGRKRVFFAPGRINLIGEHTDYTGGSVMPAAIDAGTTAIVIFEQSAVWTLTSRDFPGHIAFDRDALYDGKVEIVDRNDDGWGEYALGVIRAWLNTARTAGRTISPIPGLHIQIDSTLPQGAGLSSSASLTVLLAYLLDTLGQTDLGPRAWAEIGKRAENETVGVACGIMDHFAVAFGRKEHALLLDTHTLSYEYVPLKLGHYEFIVIDSGKRRTLLDSAYNDRFYEAERAYKEIRRRKPDLTHLGALRPEDWEKIRPTISQPTLIRRIDHIVGENMRVQWAKKALLAGDLPAFANLLTASHRSLGTNYEVTGPELDALVEIALMSPGALGARMMGAGFGGAVLSVIRREKREAFMHDVRSRYFQETGLHPRFYHFRIDDGVRERRDQT